jgi:hypothetical protein
VGDDQPPSLEPPAARASLPQDVAVFEIALDELEHGSVTGGAALQSSNICTTQGGGRGERAGPDDIDQLHSEA